MRVLMTGGGTAGHINPALAIANTIKKNIPDAEIEFVGTERGLENTLVTKEGYKLHHVNIMGISRSLSPKNIPWQANLRKYSGAGGNRGGCDNEDCSFVRHTWKLCGVKGLS